MVVNESFVTRKPLEFTLVVMVIIFIILIPIYLYVNMTGDKDVKESVLLTDTYAEIEYIFSSESDFSENDKRNLFKFNYKDNMVQWTGALLACKYIENGVYSVSMDHTGDDFGDVIFNTFTNCTTIPLGSSVKYKITLIDWKTTIFIGKEGELIEWD